MLTVASSWQVGKNPIVPSPVYLLAALFKFPKPFAIHLLVFQFVCHKEKKKEDPMNGWGTSLQMNCPDDTLKFGLDYFQQTFPKSFHFMLTRLC